MSEKTVKDKLVNTGYLKCLYTLTGLAVLYTAYLAQDIILLLLLVSLVSLLLSPGMRVLESMRIPRVLGASLLLSVILLPAIFLGVQLQAPISKWAKVLPELSVQVSDQIQALNKVIDNKANKPVAKQKVEEKKKSWFSWFESDKGPEVESVDITPESDRIQNRITDSLISVASDLLVSTPFVIIQMLTAIVLILFTMVYSPALFQHYVKLFVQEERREHVNELALNAQMQLSRYIVSVSLVNLGLAVAAILYLHAIGLTDAALLGALIGLLNFVPYIGPLIGVGLLLIGGYVEWGIDITVLFCVGGVVILNIIESQFVTPLVLAQQMKINPFVIILWLLFCGWMWGLLGVLIAVPLVVCIKMLLSQLGDGAERWVKLLAT